MPRDTARGYLGGRCGDGGGRSYGGVGAAAVSQPLTLTPIVEFSAKWLLLKRLLLLKANFLRALGRLTVVGFTHVASIEERNAVLRWRACLEFTPHAILVFGAIGRAICLANTISACTDRTAVDDAVVASWDVCVCM